MENVERIAKMEEILQEAKTVLTGLEAALEDYRNIEADIRILQEYFDSDAWMNDFEADEDGLLQNDQSRKAVQFLYILKKARYINTS